MANSSTRGLLAMFATALLGICSACSSEPKDTEQPVPVQIVPVSQSTLDETVTANAVLFPIAQSALRATQRVRGVRSRRN